MQRGIELFEKLKKSSIGKDKKVKNDRVKKVVKKAVHTIAVLTIAMACLAGCSQGKSNTNTQTSSIPSTSQSTRYSESDIRSYEMLRTIDMFDNNNLTDYTLINGERSYNYTASDYKNIKELDESYVHGVFEVCNEQTTNNICEALGYEDLDNYLEVKGFKNGEKISYTDWNNYNNQMISEIMSEDSLDGKSK